MAPDVLSTLVLPASRDAGTPCLTYLDPRTGERTELSGRAVGLWVSKTANFVADELGLQPGDVLALRLPAHWQAWTWLLGAWLAGCVVDVAPAGAGLPDDAEAAIVAASDLDGPGTAGTRIPLVSLALRPMALPGPPPPADVVDFDTEVRVHGDRWAPRPGDPPGRLRAADPATSSPQGTPWPDLRTAATGAGDGTGRRLLTTLAPATAEAVARVTAALATGTSVVLLGARPASGGGGADPGGADPGGALAGEGVTHATSECRDLVP